MSMQDRIVALALTCQKADSHPFRRLPLEVVATVKAMARSWPTPSAIAIQEAGLRFEWEDGGLDVSIIRPRDGGYFIVAASTMRVDPRRVGTYTTNLLSFSIPPPAPELGRVLSKTEEVGLAFARYLAGQPPTSDFLHYLSPPPPGDDWFSAYALHLHEQSLQLLREDARRWAHLFPPTR